MRFLLSKLRIFLFFPIPYLSQPLRRLNGFVFDIRALKIELRIKSHRITEDDAGELLKGFALAQDFQNRRIGEKQDQRFV